MTIVGNYLSPASTIDDPTKDDSHSALLSRLPTKTLGAVASISKGKTGIKDALPGRFPLVVTAEARSTSDHFDFEGPGVMIPMVSSTGHGDASLKRIHIQDGQYAVGSILAVVQPNDSSVLSARYLHAYLSAFKDELLVSRMVGTANVSLTVAKISDVPVPLLPIQGQQRIDELMALCDRLEAEQADAEAAHARLVATLLGTLTQSADAADLAANWQRLAEHFDTLFTTEASLDALKQTILQLAVMGKLVPQDPNDEPASELLKRIAKERTRLEAVGTCKISKPAQPVVGDESAFSIPNTWNWVRLGALTKLITKGSSPKWQGVEYVNSEEGVLFLTSENVGNYVLRKLDALKFVDPRFNEIEPRSILRYGDILINLVGASIGRTARFDLTMVANINQAVALVRLINGENLDSNYLLHFLNSNFARKHMQASQVVNAQPNISLTDVRDFPVPFPPLAEQHRIVAKVDELLALCDHLKAGLAESRARQEHLAATLIESALQAA